MNMIRVHKREMLYGVVIVICLSFLLSCVDKTQMAALANAGVTASTSLSDYYGLLAQEVTDVAELEAYEASLRGIRMSAPDFDRLNKTRAALRARQRMAVALDNVYNSLTNLASYDAAAEVKGAATALASSVKGLPILPDSSVDPSALIGDLVGEIAELKQQRDMLKAARVLQKEVLAIQKLFSLETPQYSSIVEERCNKVVLVAKTMIDMGWLGTAALLQEVPPAVGLEWIGPKELTGDDQRTAVKQLLDARISRYADASADATQAEAQLLAELAKQQGAFIGKARNVSVGDVSSLIAKANTYLDYLKTLRSN
jgi:hypothetical protein